MVVAPFVNNGGCGSRMWVFAHPRVLFICCVDGSLTIRVFCELQAPSATLVVKGLSQKTVEDDLYLALVIIELGFSRMFIVFCCETLCCGNSLEGLLSERWVWMARNYSDGTRPGSLESQKVGRRGHMPITPGTTVLLLTSLR